MIPRLKLRQLRSFASFAGLILCTSICATSASFAADDTAVADASADFMPGSERASNRPPATFFSINAVLAKLDRQRGRGPDAVRLAALPPSNFATDAQPPQKEAPPVGKEPFGLFTFRAPEGMLWHKWRGVEADMAKEQTVLDRCRADAASCPSYAAQFLRLIDAIKSKSGRARLEEAKRAACHLRDRERRLRRLRDCEICRVARSRLSAGGVATGAGPRSCHPTRSC